MPPPPGAVSRRGPGVVPTHDHLTASSHPVSGVADPSPGREVPSLPDPDEYVEQYCEDCHEETDQQVGPSPDVAACLRCGSQNRVRSEDDRVRALVQRVHEDEAALLGRLRTGVAPSV